MQNILKFSEVIEKLKLTSDIAGEQSARNFAKFIEVSTDSVENADRLGSVITELGNNFATSESQILKNTVEIQKGMTFTIEPMINQGRPDLRILPDKWTAVTVDGMISAQFEHTLFVTDDGCEVLTRLEGRTVF